MSAFDEDLYATSEQKV